MKLSEQKIASMWYLEHTTASCDGWPVPLHHGGGQRARRRVCCQTCRAGHCELASWPVPCNHAPLPTPAPHHRRRCALRQTRT